MPANSPHAPLPSAPPSGPPRKPYERPSLRIYGSVRQLTQGGHPSGFADGGGTRFRVVKGSDRAYKSNLVRIGTHPLGIGLYLFDYKVEFQEFGCGRQFGVMADEVETVMPEAVAVHPDGYKRVDYSMLGIDFFDRC